MIAVSLKPTPPRWSASEWDPVIFFSFSLATGASLFLHAVLIIPVVGAVAISLLYWRRATADAYNKRQHIAANGLHRIGAGSKLNGALVAIIFSMTLTCMTIALMRQSQQTPHPMPSHQP